MGSIFKTKRIVQVCGILVGIPLVAATTITTLNVITRKFDFPIPDVYDIVGYSMLVVASFSMVITALEKSHVAVDLLMSLLSPRVKQLIIGFGLIVSAAMCSILLWVTGKHAIYSVSIRELNTTGDLPVYPFWVLWTIGLFLLSFIFLLQGLGDIREVFRKWSSRQP